MTAAQLALVDELAADVGRLRRRFASNPAWTGSYVCDRLADRIEQLDVMLHPSAAEIAASTYPGDEHAVFAAIDHVNGRSRRIRALLGKAEA